jgi:UDP-2-acetamido-2-deoxy-ribo-hexuluronate aminotransferase
LNEEIVKVNHWADLYTQKLKDCVKCPVVYQKYESSWAQYTILLENESHRERIQEKLKTKGVPTMIYYAKGMHQQRALEQYLEYSEGCPVTENVCKRCLSLPMHPYLSEEDITYVSDEIIRVICSI